MARLAPTAPSSRPDRMADDRWTMVESIIDHRHPSRIFAMPESTVRELSGLRTIVLGSTSGIGRAVALALGAAGADVIVHGRRSAEAGRGGRRRPSGPSGSAPRSMMADLADRAEGDRLVDEAWDLWGGLDAWLHLAGADTLTGEGAKLPFDAKLDRLWAVDVVATVRLCRAVGRRMKDQGHGLDRDDGLGPGRDRDGGGFGRAFRRDQGGDPGVHPEPGARASRPRSGSTPWPPAGSGPPGASRPRPPGRSGSSARPRSSAGGRPRTSPRPAGSSSARPRRSSPARSSGSTAGPSVERRRTGAEGPSGHRAHLT